MLFGTTLLRWTECLGLKFEFGACEVYPLICFSLVFEAVSDECGSKFS
jgi:hypothetical protein